MDMEQIKKIGNAIHELLSDPENVDMLKKAVIAFRRQNSHVAAALVNELPQIDRAFQELMFIRVDATKAEKLLTTPVKKGGWPKGKKRAKKISGPEKQEAEVVNQVPPSSDPEA